MKKRKVAAASAKGGGRPPPAAPAPPAAPRLLGALVAAAVLTLLMLHLPRAAVTPDLDPSWGAVLDYAREKRLQFGTDLVFTYGPLGYLAIEWFTGHSTWLRLAFDLVLDFGIAAGLCLTAWRTGVYWRVLLLSFFVLLPATVRPGTIDVPLELGLFCWGLLCFLEAGPRERLFLGIFAAFAVVVSLVKFTFLIMAVLTVGALGAHLVRRGRSRQCGGLVIGYLAGCFCLWVLLGQKPLLLGAWLKSSLIVARGYESAMGLQFADSVWLTGVLSGVLALAVVVVRAQAAEGPPLPPSARQSWWRGLFIGWVFLLLLLAWKHGFLRAKSDLWAGFVAVVALALEAVPVSGGRRGAVWAARGCGIACGLSALALAQWKEPNHLQDLAAKAVTRLGDNAGAVVNPVGYAREMNLALETERARARLPKLRSVIGNATVDVFGQTQAYAVLNGLNYRPRPAFQAYLAYNRTLMELNERAFAAKAAPEFVLFTLGTIDGRFPPLEDARVLRTLLADYTLAGAEGPFLLLKHTASSAPRRTLLREGSFRAGEPIGVAEYGDVDLWLEISLAPSLAGRLRQALYKPPEVYLIVWALGSRQGFMFRAPVPMLAAGFLASPVALQNQDVADLYTGRALHRPGGYAIRFQPGTDAMWQDLMRYRLFRVEDKLGRNSKAAEMNTPASPAPPGS